MRQRGLQRFWSVAGLALCAFAVAAPCSGSANDAEVLRHTTDFSEPEKYEANSAGSLTSTKQVNASAFSHSSANMSFERELDFKVGNGFFRRLWVSSPASTTASDGLGPLFNARSCQRCHLKDGRGHPPAANFPKDNAISMLMRLSIPPQTAIQRAALKSGHADVIPDPTYGGQLQDFAIQGHEAEGRIHISYTDMPVSLAGGETVRLRKPAYSITHQRYGPMHPKLMMSPRVAPQMIGLGLLDAIAEKDILALADPDDQDGDGVSGKPNRVWSASQKRLALGRFGWKAGKATIVDQSAGAFAGDIGISTPLHPKGHGDCTDSQAHCQKAPSGNSKQHDDVEASQAVLDLVAFYSRNLAVPARRNVGTPSVLAGKRHFYEAGCISCHTPKFITPHKTPGMPEQARQLIWPYTDMLLHDMGDGLADNRPEAKASGNEWRTPPLWGIGLTETVSGHTFFLHDGRARNLTEAILWHGGEAEVAKEKFRTMSPAHRIEIIAFLRSL
ncbi:MAG: CxxC motif-containing protein (DUF1111 family) [Paracoccaceae bacterium]|jgi:CxxC motif-containing protein (DUF1111 family)